MQVSVETTSGLERKMTVEVPAESINSAITKRLQSLTKTVRINGFRPGKVPYKVIKKRYEPQVRSEVLGDMISSSFYDAVAQENLRPAGQPRIEPLSDSPPQTDDGDGFSYTAVFEVYPEFEPQYDASIEINKPTVDITEADIDEMLETLRKQRMQYVETERASQTDDQINIDFVGSVDGVEFDGGKAEDAPLVLGSGAMIPGFEEQLLGLQTGAETVIDVTFPEEYGNEELAGKAAKFDIKVRSVNEPQLPELDEELIKSFGIESGQIDDFRADIRKNMERELKQRVDSQVKQQVMDGLLNLNDIEVPKALEQQEISRLREQLAQQMPPQNAENAPLELPDDMFSDEAKRRVKLGLVVGEIVRHRGLKADDAAVRKQVESIAATYQEPQQVIDYYLGNKELLQNVEGLVLEEAVTQSVLDTATIKEQKMTFQEIMNPTPADTENESSEESEAK